MSANHIQQGALEYLQRKAAEPVEVAVAYFSTIPPPPRASFVSLCTSTPDIFTSLDALDQSYTQFHALPVPNPSQLSEIRELLNQSTSQDPLSTPNSCANTFSTLRAPTMPLSLLPGTWMHPKTKDLRSQLRRRCPRKWQLPLGPIELPGAPYDCWAEED